MAKSSHPAPQYAVDEILKLYHLDQLIGIVSYYDLDWPWYGGRIEPTAAAKQFEYIWEFFAIDGNRQVDPPFEIPEAFEQDWFVEDANGQRLAIDDLPAVQPGEKTVWWRFA